MRLAHLHFLMTYPYPDFYRDEMLIRKLMVVTR